MMCIRVQVDNNVRIGQSSVSQSFSSYSDALVFDRWNPRGKTIEAAKAVHEALLTVKAMHDEDWVHRVRSHVLRHRLPNKPC